MALPASQAGEAIKPFILASKTSGNDLSATVMSTRNKLQAAGFVLYGQYSPYAGTEIIVFGNEALLKTTTRSKRGGYAAPLRAAVTANQGMIELSYTNPIYWANVYRLDNNLDAIAKKLKSALGYQQDFGTGKNSYSAAEMRKYHYTFMMEYFDDPSLLAFYDSHEKAVAVVQKNLTGQLGGSKQVYRLDLGKDSDGKAMTLFGVGLAGVDGDDCSSDAYIMNRIDKSSPRHSAHLPYEVLVYGDHVEALYGRFRIAVSWPHLPMLASDTGATFFSIMCAPGAIENTLIKLAGGSRLEPGSEK